MAQQAERRAERQDDSGGLIAKLGVDKLRRPPKPEIDDPIARAKFTERDGQLERRPWAESYRTSQQMDDFVPERLRGPNTVGLRQSTWDTDESEN